MRPLPALLLLCGCASSQPPVGRARRAAPPPPHVVGDAFDLSPTSAMERHCVTGDLSERERGLLCFMAARDVRRDRIGRPGNPALAAELNRLGCEHGSADACSTLADMVDAGEGVAPNAERALVLRRRAAELVAQPHHGVIIATPPPPRAGEGVL